jgi:hypothetical protein
MRRFLAILALAATAGTATAVAAIQPDRLLAHVKFLAADDLKGRGNGSDELAKAADYIAGQLENTGAQPGLNGSWKQPFELVAGVAIGRENTLTITSRGVKVTLVLGRSYYPLAALAGESTTTPSALLSGVPLVFAGYGLSASSLGYDDYAGFDVKDKAVLIFSHEPQEQDAGSKLNGSRPLGQTTLQAKASAARRAGARALLVVSDPTHRTDEGSYTTFPFDPDAENVGIPVLRLRRAEMRPLLDAWGLEALARDIDRDLMPRSRPLPATTIDYVEHLSINRRTVANLVGVLPGSDPTRAGEAIVIGAHYDHVGFGGRYSAAPDRTGEIHNGADDNASGTAAVIEIARAAAENRGRFPRTLVFVLFAGEERGLLGSEYYARNPVIAIDRTVAMLNLDMVGRANGAVDVSGLEASPSLETDLRAATQAAGRIAIRRSGPGAGRSDDSSFINRRVPAINFFTGFHDDYHRPSDDWQKVDVPGLRTVAMLAYEFAAQIASRPSRPEFVGK